MSTVDGHSLEELIPVHVPRSMLDKVYALLSGQFRLVPVVADSASEAGDQRWSVEDCRRLLRDSRPSARRMIGVLDVLAESDKTPIPLVDLAVKAGLTPKELQGMLGGFTRVCRSIWPGRGDATLWPMEVSSGPDAHYTMDTRTAQNWVTARRSSS